MLHVSASKASTLTTLFMMGVILDSSQAAPTKPMDRYTQWASVKSTIRVAAQTIGYSETSWNKFSQSIEKKSLFTINQDTPAFMDEVAIIGINEESWDCYIVSYFPFKIDALLLLAHEVCAIPSRTIIAIIFGAN
jgi:hypothetical protein